ncbi:MAG TPA: hypothetical protein VGF99_16730 [Myxococcota bacterium]
MRLLPTLLLVSLPSLAALSASAQRSLDDDDAPPTTASTTDEEEAPVEEAPVPVRTVALMPLVPGRTITSKQAAGLTARLREALTAIAEEGTLRVLTDTKDDDKAVRRCGVDRSCWTDVASVRGADRLGFGSIELDDGGGLRLTLSTTTNSEAKTAVFAGERSDDLARFDRLARELFAEESLRGTLIVSGQTGDIVLFDGRRRGTIGADREFRLERVREGEHRLEVRRPPGRNGTLYDPFTRTLTIAHREEARVKVTLLPREQTATLGEDTQEGPPLLGIVGVGVGSAAIVGGVVVGVLSLMNSFEVEERAENQQLFFPRDSGLVQQGRTLALTSSILVGVGVVAAGAGAAVWALSGPAPSEEDLAVDDGSTVVGGAR